MTITEPQSDHLAELVARVEIQRALPPPARRRAIRRKAGVSQDEVGAACGVSRATVSHWETGVSSPRGEYLRLYVAALDVMAGR